MRCRGECCGAAFRRRDVTGDGDDLNIRVQRSQFRCRSFQRVGTARRDDHVDAFHHQRFRTAFAQAFARGADQRPFAFDSQFHCFFLLDAADGERTVTTLHSSRSDPPSCLNFERLQRLWCKQFVETELSF